jgi:DNA repair ATPase RecN
MKWILVSTVVLWQKTVGRLMRQLGWNRQVMAVTHLPQVTACADQHLVVAKQLESGWASQLVDLSHGEARVQEIARACWVAKTLRHHARARKLDLGG